MTWLPSLYENFYSSMNISLWYKMGALFSDSRIIYSKVEVLSCLHSNRESHKVKSSFCEADPSRLRRDGFQLESKARPPGCSVERWLCIQSLVGPGSAWWACPAAPTSSSRPAAHTAADFLQHWRWAYPACPCWPGPSVPLWVLLS